MTKNIGTAIVLAVLFLLSTIGVVDGAINLISNPGFESGTASWLFYTNGIGTFTAVSPGFEGTNAAKLTLSTGGTNIQLYQAGISLEPNTQYRLSFSAYSTSGHDLSVNFIKHGSPFTNYGLEYRVNLGTNWQTFTTEFTTTSFTGTVNDGRLMFWLAPYAAADDTYYIDSIILEKVGTDTLEARLAALEADMTTLKAENTALKSLLAGVTRNGNDIYIDGANVHIRDGTGDTAGPVNGLGNLIIGYNELRGIGDNRTGSHNLILGSKNNYGSYGGLVAGYENSISGAFASVSGGTGNTASGGYTSVSGGSGNEASDASVGDLGDPEKVLVWSAASVSGGKRNTASGMYSSVSGGESNTASGEASSVSGGFDNSALEAYSPNEHPYGSWASVSGGAGNVAYGIYSSVSGGNQNWAGECCDGFYASVSGGTHNRASGLYSSVSGGQYNGAEGASSSVSGGSNNTAGDFFNESSSVSGGKGRSALGDYDWVAGLLFQDQ